MAAKDVNPSNTRSLQIHEGSCHQIYFFKFYIWKIDFFVIQIQFVVLYRKISSKLFCDFFRRSKKGDIILKAPELTADCT